MEPTKNFLCLLLGILFIKCVQSQAEHFANQNAYRIEPYQVNPPGLEEERKRLMYPYDRHDYVTDIGVVRSIHDAALPCRLPFFGFHYQNMLIHKDGYITFNRGLVSYDFPLKLPIHVSDPLREEDPSIIAPWLSQQDIPRNVPNAGVYFRIVDLTKEENVTLRERILRDFREGMIGANKFTARCAMIVTWKNISFANPQPDKPTKTNTYQAVIATDDKNTYAMFNYEWISWISHMDNYDGMRGPQAYVGFNAGNMTRSFEFKPYSQHPYISSLAERGFSNGLKGRYMFQIDEEIYFGSCIERDMDPNWNERPLSFFPRYGSMLGGTLVNITGPCIPKNKKTLTVKFDYKNVECVVRDENHATCISPPLMYHGYIDISTGIDDKSFFHHGRWYIQPPDIVEEGLKISGEKDRELEPDEIELSWDGTKLAWHQNAQVYLHLWGYRETEAFPELTYITSLVTGGINLNIPSYKLDVKQLHDRDDGGKSHLTFGFISMNLSDSTILGRDIKTSPVLWSRPMPLGWFFKPQWDKKYGHDKWREQACLKWYQNEKYSDRFAHTTFRCPCTRKQAEIERGCFSPDTLCNTIDRNCETFHQGAHHCILSGRPAVGGAGQLCCYDDHGELMQTGDTMYGGRPSRAFKYGKHPYKQKMMIPTMSNWEHDVMPFFFCCKWHPNNDNSDTCDKYKYWRTSQDCSSYTPPGIGSVFGDPHIRTFDRVNYTFNGKGEFVLTRVSDPVHKIDIQARFEQVSKRHWLDPDVNGTLLTAITAQDNQSSVVEFRLRPPAARWRYHLYVIVDKEYIFFWDDSLRIQTFQGVTLYQPSGTWNMSHIVAMFDSGAGVEVKSGNGHMSAHVYLPMTFMNKTRGLLGNWSGIEDDDFAVPSSEIRVYPQADSRSIFRDFGNHWRLAETEKKGVGASLFFHQPVPFAQYDDPKFDPEYGNPPRRPDNFSYSAQEVDRVCSSSTACRYDFIVTADRELATMTQMQDGESDFLARSVRELEIRCHALPRPINGRKSEIRYFPGSIVRFVCDEGYRLVGTEVRRCRENGLWTWGFDTQCIPTGTYSAKIGGISVAIIIPIVVCGAFIVICFMRIRRRQGERYTGEPGYLPKTVVELHSKRDVEKKKEKMETVT